MEDPIINRLIRLPASLAARVEAYRFDAHIDLKNDAFVQVIEMGLDAIDKHVSEGETHDG